MALSSSLSHWKSVGLSAAVAGTQGMVNSAAPLSIKDTEELGVTPGGEFSYLGASGSERLTLSLSPGLGLTQGLSGGIFAPYRGDARDYRTANFSHELGIVGTTRLDSVRMSVSLGYESRTESRFAPDMFPAGEGQYGQFSLSWSRDLTPSWSSAVGAQVYGAREARDAPPAFGPAGHLGLGWRGQRLSASASVDRGVRPSIVLGGLFLTDRGALRGGGRFGHEERFELAGIFSYQRLQTLRADAPDQHPVQMWIAHLLLTTRPWPRRAIAVSLSYGLTDQRGGVLGRRELQSFRRNVILVMVTAGLPPSPESLQQEE